ncbi:MAG TPA: hypothetical protein VFN25_08210 [Dokdonella sp.]|uniref:hypothetical protein n=1 Tax=Dokdonella sp. TaxID=2291710 RepID=UPI002D7FEAEF|nr:hypothetical protein [Dokdonella sp.]HET9032874.1 hypothetical protein [Dokdonella sp.]
MRAQASFNRFLLFALLAGVSSLANAGPLRLDVQMPTTYTGTEFSYVIQIRKENIGDGIVYSGMFTVHSTLPEGMTFLYGNGGGWTCTVTGADSREMICTKTTTLTDTNYNMSVVSITAHTDIDMPLAPVEISTTLSSAQVPLPPILICEPSPSTNGCATVNPTVQESKIEILGWGAGHSNPVDIWSLEIEAGSLQNIIPVYMVNTGFGPSNTPAILKVKFPAGVTYSGFTSGIPAWNCSAAMEIDGQLLTCTVPYMASGQVGFASIRTDFAPDIVVPGPLYFHAAIGNDQVAPPTTCAADPYQRGCGRLAVNTRPPSAAYLRFSDPDVQHSPAYFTIGQDNGPVVVNFRNIGDGVAANTAVQIKLPRGFAYTQTYSAIPALTCTTSGSLANGQLLTCQGASMAAGSTGYVSFGVYLDPTLTESPGPLPLVGAIDSSNPANTTLLAACASDPNQINCFWHEIPTYAPCALQYGMDGIFCDAFEELGLPNRPQAIHSDRE